MNRKEKGYFYERKAVEFLISQGYEILAVNYIGQKGEIDIVSKIERTVVFVEVKYRSTTNFGYGSESVDKRKRRRIYQTAREFLRERQLYGCDTRFDLISYLGEQQDWTKNLIWGDEIGF